jgi:hypothetical protein
MWNVLRSISTLLLVQPISSRAIITACHYNFLSGQRRILHHLAEEETFLQIVTFQLIDIWHISVSDENEKYLLVVNPLWVICFPESG